MNSMIITLLILLAVIIAFISGKIPMSMIGILTIFALVVFKVVPAKTAFSSFTDSSVLLFAAMFIVAKGIQKTTIVTSAANLVKKFKDKPRLLTFFACIIAFFLAIVSNGTIALVVMLPILTSICDDIDLPRSKLLYPYVVTAVSSAGAWFLGIGALNMSWSSVMIKLGAKTPLNINDFLIARLPFIIVIILYMTFIGPKLLPAVDNKKIAEVNSNSKKEKKATTLSKTKNIIGIIIITLTIILMILSSYIKVDSYLIAIGGAVCLVLFGVLDNKEALGALNLNIIFLISGMLSLADALQSSGAGKLLGQAMANLASGIHNDFLLMGLFFLVTIILTNFLGGLGAVSILVPLWTVTALQMGLDPRGAVLAASTASAFSFLIPIGGRSLLLIVDEGGYKYSDFIKCGLPLMIILCIMGCFVPQFMYPL